MNETIILRKSAGRFRSWTRRVTSRRFGGSEVLVETQQTRSLINVTLKYVKRGCEDTTTQEILSLFNKIW